MAVDIIARAMAANASGGEVSLDYGNMTNKPHINGIPLEGNKAHKDLGINDVPIIDAAGSDKIDLDSYTSEGLYVIKGNNLKQVSLTTTFNFMYVTGDTQWIIEGYFLDNSLLRQIIIKRTIGESASVSYNVPNSINSVYQRNASPYIALSTTGANNLYGELKNSIGYNRDSSSLHTLANLTTSDKTSLINAINEINTKIDNTTFVINLSEYVDQGIFYGIYTADKTHEEIKAAYDKNKTLVVSIGGSKLPMLNAEIASNGDMGMSFGYTNLVVGGQIVTTRAIHYLYTSENGESWQDADATTEVADKDYVENFYQNISGYDETKNQVLKHIKGTLTWVDES